MSTLIKLRRDTAANWAAEDPVLQLGEPGYDTTNNELRIGDGTTAWSGLTPIAGGGGGSYGNANVATFLAAFGANTISTSGNVTVGNLIGTVANATYATSAGTAATATTAATVTTAAQPNITSVGNLTSVTSSGNISTTGNVSGAYFLGDGSQLTNLPSGTYGNSNVVTLLANLGSNTISTTANITVGNLIGAGNLIGIGTNGRYWNFDGFASNLIVPAGSNIKTPISSNGNINIHPDGNGQIIMRGSTTSALLVLFSDTANALNRIEIDTFGNSSVLGGVYSGRFARGGYTSPESVLGGDRLAALTGKGYDGSAFSRFVGSVSVDAYDNWTPGNVPSRLSFYTTGYNDGSNPILNMQISPNGNVDIFNGNLNVTGGYVSGYDGQGINALFTGIPGFTPLGSNVVAQFSANADSYTQINFQNISSGTLASADYIITADNGTDSTYFVDLGIASSNHSDPDFFGDTSTSNDAYLYVVGTDSAGPGDSGAGNLILGSTNGTIKMFVGNTAQANVVQTVSTNGVTISGVVKTVPVTVDTLPGAALVGAGSRAFVTDANAIAFYNIVGNGGGNSVPVFSDGTDWRIG